MPKRAPSQLAEPSTRSPILRRFRIAALFCGTQKSLINGLSTAKVLFGGTPTLGLIVLPLMIYHQLQLTLGALIARRYLAQRGTRSP